MDQSEVIDDQILAKGPRSSINASGDGSNLADFSLTNPPVPLCHSTSAEETNQLEQNIFETNPLEQNIFESSPLEQNIFDSGISIIDTTNSTGSNRAIAELASIPILAGRITPPETKTDKKNLSVLETSKDTTAESSAGSSKHQYWLRERKHKFSACGDAGEKIMRAKNVFKKRRGKKKKQLRKAPKKLIKSVDHEKTNNTNPNDDDDDHNHDHDRDRGHDHDHDHDPFLLTLHI